MIDVTALELWQQSHRGRGCSIDFDSPHWVVRLERAGRVECAEVRDYKLSKAIEAAITEARKLGL